MTTKTNYTENEFDNLMAQISNFKRMNKTEEHYTYEYNNDTNLIDIIYFDKAISLPLKGEKRFFDFEIYVMKNYTNNLRELKLKRVIKK